MTKNEFIECLSLLRITPKDAATLLSVDSKTVNRWLDGDVAVPGPAEQAIRAWVRFHRIGLPWRPDGLPLDYMTDEEVAKQILKMREHVVEMDAVILRVRERGGVAAPWKVDLKRCHAELGGVMRVHFHPLPNGNFAVSSYNRTDKEPDRRRDLPLIEDALVSIAEAVAEAKRAGRNWIDER